MATLLRDALGTTRRTLLAWRRGAYEGQFAAGSLQYLDPAAAKVIHSPFSN